MKNYTADWFKKLLNSVPPEIKNFNRLSMGVAATLNELIKIQFNGKQKLFAGLFGKKESEISKWLNGRHNFTFKTIAQIEAKTNSRILYTSFELTNKYNFIGGHKSPHDFKIVQMQKSATSGLTSSVQGKLPIQERFKNSGRTYHSQLTLVASPNSESTVEVSRAS